MSLQISSLNTPIGKLNLIADGELLLGANFSSVKALKDGLDDRYLGSEFRIVRTIAHISPFIADYFAGDLTAINQVVGFGFTFNASDIVVNTTLNTLQANVDLSAIPEPSVASLLALGTVGLVALRVRRKS
jgi:hypothetical protein